MQLILKKRNSRLQIYRWAEKGRKTPKSKNNDLKTPACLWSGVTVTRYLLSSISRKQTHMSRQRGPEKRFPHHKSCLFYIQLSPTLTHVEEKQKKQNKIKHSKCFTFFQSFFVPGSLAAVPDASAASTKWVRPLSVCCYWFRTADIAAVCLTHSSKKLSNRTQTHNNTLKRTS